jgi:hypothetical protein
MWAVEDAVKARYKQFVQLLEQTRWDRRERGAWEEG